MALYFNHSDIGKLWDLAARHVTDDDVSMFAKTARATERGLPVVLECTLRSQLDELMAFFPRHGVEPPRVEELRV